MKEKRKIWYISKYAVVPGDGNPTRQYFFSKYFAGKNYDVTLFSSKSSGIKNCKIKGIAQKKEIDGFCHVLINGPEISLGFSMKRIISWLIFETLLLFSAVFTKIKKPDVIIVSSLSVLTVITGYIFKKIYGAKLIFEIRDIWPLSLTELKNISGKNPFVFFLRIIEKFGYKKSDYIVGTMPKLDQHISKSIKKSFKFACIPMGYDPEFYENTEKLPDKIKNKLPENKFIVGYAGSVGVANCVEEITEAAKILNKKNPDIHFVILGDGALKKILIKTTENLNNITFLPKIQKKYVNDFLSSCNLLLNPWQDLKMYEYGVSPNKWIDYMYAGKPVIVSYNGYRSIINEANCGEFIPANNPELLADKISEYSKKNPEELNKIGENGKKYLEKNLKYETLAEKYIKIFKKLTDV